MTNIVFLERLRVKNIEVKSHCEITYEKEALRWARIPDLPDYESGRSTQLSYPAVNSPLFAKKGGKNVSFSKVLKYFLLIDAILSKLALVEVFI